MIDIKYKLSTILNYLVDNLYSLLGHIRAELTRRQCYLCDAPCQPPHPICENCYRDLPWNHNHCQRCQLPMDNSGKENRLICGLCLQQAPSFRVCLAPLRYEAPIQGIIQHFKYSNQRYLGQLMSGLLVDEIRDYYSANEIPLPKILMPVPLHQTKRKQRGFNQAEDIADFLGRSLGLSVDRKSLIKARPTEAQASLSKSDRTKNLRDSFRIKPLQHWESIALIDDVMTTMATAEYLSALLLAAGAKEVHVWCLARTPKQH